MSTLNALEQDLYRRLGFQTGTPDTATQTRLRAFLNETQQEIVSEPGMDVMLNDTITFASVASTPEYSLPPAVARLITVRETTNRTTLGLQSKDWYRSRYPDPTAITGIPTDVVDMGYTALSTQPSNASELFVISDSATDGATKTAYLEGYITGGYVRSASVALNGITAASFGAAITTWIGITKFYIALTAGGTTTAAGNVTLREDSGVGTELARIAIGQDYSRYRRIALAICPSSVLTYSVDFQRDVTDMSIATDEPVLPPRFHRVLGLGARMKEYEKEQDSRYPVARLDFQNGVKALKYFLFSQAVGSPNLRGTQAQQPSRLGGWYPAGT